MLTVGCDTNAETVDFWIHNVQPMTRDVQLQVFQRAFSTKGTGRGLGTYSARLIGAHVLGGKVWFTSNRDDGTTFHIALPLRPATAPNPDVPPN